MSSIELPSQARVVKGIPIFQTGAVGSMTVKVVPIGVPGSSVSSSSASLDGFSTQPASPHRTKGPNDDVHILGVAEVVEEVEVGIQVGVLTRILHHLTQEPSHQISSKVGLPVSGVVSLAARLLDIWLEIEAKTATTIETITEVLGEGTADGVVQDPLRAARVEVLLVMKAQGLGQQVDVEFIAGSQQQMASPY